MSLAPVLEGSIPFALDRRIGSRDLRERNDFDGLDLRYQDGNVLEVKDDFNVAWPGKLFAVSFDAPEETCAGALPTAADEGQKLFR
jgi:hypothetical protein